ncbi:hypothetical protein CTAM01_04275 [Colletotrichum tamarilloi]|uniref:Uncharacterized protein n=1 Tax=Colletotrichum tamarilloi TaxID=1209934 RepID=A0ABQ9RHP2_9PEZI|nr:uncharacterized protein CTAM01_04275 [Colletotrichum tamarilloi]KAK1504045.1 hypothetical protein CTAM01_04275 [Colletotrichum tamarilloi]
MRISELEAPNDLWSFPPWNLLALSLLIKTVFTSVERLQSRIQASEPRDSRRNFPGARRKVLSPIRAFFVSHAHCVCHPPANPVLYSSTISLPLLSVFSRET